jgi:hypothetical protein
MFVRPEEDPRSDGGLGDARHMGHAGLLRERIDGRVSL